MARDDEIVVRSAMKIQEAHLNACPYVIVRYRRVGASPRHFADVEVPYWPLDGQR